MNEYLQKELKYYTKLNMKAYRGDEAALNELKAANDRYAKQANKQLRQLERKGFNYGAAYNYATDYTQAEYQTNRFQLSNNIEDSTDIIVQLQQEIKFLSYKSSTVEGQEDILYNKTEKFMELGIFDENISKRSAKSFIKFLGNEEAQAIIEEYAQSEKVTEMIYDVFQSRKNTIGAIKKAFLKYLAEKNSPQGKKFDELMAELGVNVYNNKYRTQRDYYTDIWD